MDEFVIDGMDSESIVNDGYDGEAGGSVPDPAHKEQFAPSTLRHPTPIKASVAEFVLSASTVTGRLRGFANLSIIRKATSSDTGFKLELFTDADYTTKTGEFTS